MDKIFPQHIYKFEVPNYKEINKDIISEIHKLYQEDPMGVQMTNSGGWHSENQKPKFEELSQIISNCFSKFILNLDDNINIGEIWANVNYPNSSNISHNHGARTYMSGVYYVKVSKNCGNLYFLNPNTTSVMKRYPEIFVEEIKNYEIEYEPKEGDLYFFRGNLMHGVKENLSGDDRISISFNFPFPREENESACPGIYKNTKEKILEKRRKRGVRK